MSLINEALKRSESDKRRNSSPYFDNLTVMRPDDDDELPPPPRPTFEAHDHDKRPTSRVLILALVAAAAFGGWYLWSRSTGHVGPREASANALDEADKPLPLEQMHAAVKRVAPDPTLNKHNTDSLAGNKIDKKAKPTKLKAEDAFTAAMRKLEQARHKAKAPSTTAPVETSKPPGATGDETGAAATGKPEPAPTTPPPAAPPVKLRLTAIMRGPDGNVAIINGSLYREGQTVKGATILKIGQYEVELVADGKRFTIRI